MKKILILMLMLVVTFGKVLAQGTNVIKSIGIPIIYHLEPSEIKAHPQNYAVVQGSNGVMYFANQDGLLVFDGYQWQIFSNPNKSGISTLKLDEKNNIYVGSVDEFGYYEVSEGAKLRYTSLLPLVPPDQLPLGPIRGVEIIGNNIIFQTSDRLLIYNKESEQVSVISDLSIASSFVFDNDFAIYDPNRGYFMLKDGKLEIIPWLKGFSDAIIGTIDVNNKLIIVSANSGLYELIGQELSILPAFNYLASFEIIDIKANKAGYFAFTTSNSGIIIMDEAGNLLQHLNKSRGLVTDMNYATFFDAAGNLWVTHLLGITHVNLTSPFSIIDERMGLEGSVIKMIIDDDRILVGTYSGLFESSWSKLISPLPDARRFRKVPEVQNSVWFFQKMGDQILIGTRYGLFALKDGKYELVYPNEFIWAMTKIDERHVLAGTRSGNLIVFEKINNVWRFMHQMQGFQNHIDFLEYQNGSSAWMTDSGTDIFLLEWDANYQLTKATKYGGKEGLPSNLENRVFRQKDGLVFGTLDGVYGFDELKNVFTPHPKYNEVLRGNQIYRFEEFPDGDVLYTKNDTERGLLRKQQQGGYIADTAAFALIEGKYTTETMYAHDHKNGFIGGSKGLVHYDPSMKMDQQADFRVNIMSINLINSSDSMVYNGIVASLIPNFEFPFSDNALSITFAAPHYDSYNNTLYQYRVVGQSNHWSRWESSNTQELTYLPHGNFRFEVRARNIYGQISEPVGFDFVVLPTWYFTPWAYFAYFILLIACIFGLVKVYAHRLKRENEALEAIVDLRTKELRQKSEQLKELDEAKTRFFINISHELRTPITLIKSPLTNLLGDTNEKLSHAAKEKLSLSVKNSDQLLNLVEEILDLSKMDIGKLELHNTPNDICRLIKLVFSSFESATKEHGINYSMSLSLKCKDVFFDEGKLTKIINNLISNALKFTTPGGSIHLEVNQEDTTEKLWTVIEVSDSGEGIPADLLDRIFDRYYQVNQQRVQLLGGTGIGLALVKELANLMGGTVGVASELQKGSTFTVKLPLQPVGADQLPALENVIIPALEENNYSTFTSLFDDAQCILIAEDNSDMRKFIAGLLKARGYKVEEASNGQEAWEKIGLLKPNLVITDLMMPRVNGFELVKMLKSDQNLRDTPTIMLSARATSQDKILGLSLGVDDYLFKPFVEEELLVRIQNLLQNKQLRSISAKPKDEETLKSVDEQVLQKLMGLVEKQLSNSSLKIEDIAIDMSMGDRQLHRLTLKLTGLTPANLIKEVRLDKARKMLEARNKATVAEVAYAVGYENPGYFSKVYFQRYGKMPSDYF